MSERPTPLTDEAIRAAGGQWTFLARDLSRDLERQLAAAIEEREQMGKQAHANACEAMEYRRQLAERDAHLEEARTTLHQIARPRSMSMISRPWDEITRLAEIATEALAGIDGNVQTEARHD